MTCRCFFELNRLQRCMAITFGLENQVYNLMNLRIGESSADIRISVEFKKKKKIHILILYVTITSCKVLRMNLNLIFCSFHLKTLSNENVYPTTILNKTRNRNIKHHAYVFEL